MNVGGEQLVRWHVDAGDGYDDVGLSRQRQRSEYGSGKDSGYGDTPRNDLHADATLDFAEGCGPQQKITWAAYRAGVGRMSTR